MASKKKKPPMPDGSAAFILPYGGWNTVESAVSLICRRDERPETLENSPQVNVTAAHSGRTHMNVQGRSVRRRGMLATLGVAAVAAASMLIASPAQAGNGRIVISFGSRPQLNCRPEPICKPSYSEIEYARGFERGECDGFDAGYRDGVAGRIFCNHVETCSGSRYFQNGFERGFAKSYSAGFEKGRCERLERERRERERHVHNHGHSHGHAHGHGHSRWARR
jgi:hypothetical protein